MMFDSNKRVLINGTTVREYVDGCKVFYDFTNDVFIYTHVKYKSIQHFSNDKIYSETNHQNTIKKEYRVTGDGKLIAFI